VVESVYHHTQGQPWLVNAIACEIVEQILEGDVSREILPQHVEQAVQTLILRRDTHIDSLMERLKEARVQRIVEPVILGESAGFSSLDDDYQYVLDLGLLRYTSRQLVPANPIYAEIIIRTLSSEVHMEIDEPDYLPDRLTYVIDGKLDMKRLLSDFQQFWRANCESWIKRYQYVEAAPHLTLQAFLQRIINSGGVVTREMAAGNKRLDLYIQYQGFNYPIELKIRYGDKTYKEGLDQLGNYRPTNFLVKKVGWLFLISESVPHGRTRFFGKPIKLLKKRFMLWVFNDSFLIHVCQWHCRGEPACSPCVFAQLPITNRPIYGKPIFV